MIIEISNKDRQRIAISNLYRYSDLSVEAIAWQLDLNLKEVQQIVDELTKNDALEVLVDQYMTRVEAIMTPNVITIDYSKNAYDAAKIMTEKEVGSIIVTKNGRPYGMVTEKDIVRGGYARDGSFKNVRLEQLASRPLIYAERGLSLEEATDVMLKNKIRKLPVIGNGELIGIVTITDIAMFLSPSRRPGLHKSVLQAMSRGREIKTYKETNTSIQNQ